MPDSSVDAIITDPPYGLSAPPDMAQVLSDWLADVDFEHHSAGFMGAKWDGFVPGPATWRECYRVLKPGGHLAAFAAPRTQDLMGLALRLAGFEVRDAICWLNGQGFPKSMDVSKAIDKAAGRDAAESAKRLKAWRTEAGLSRDELAELVGCTTTSIRDWEEGRSRRKGAAPEWLVPSPAYQQRLDELCSYGTDARTIVARAAERVDDGTVLGLGHTGAIYGKPTTELARDWQGWGTALKPGYEPILLVRKPLEGTVANNVLTHGTGALNIDRSRIGNAEVTINRTDGWTGFGQQERPDYEPSQSHGRFPANVALTHHPDCHLVGAKTVKADGHHPKTRGSGGLGTSGHSGQSGLDERSAKTETVEAWNCVDGCPVGELDRQSGTTRSAGGRTANISTTSKIYGAGKGLGQDIDPDLVRGDPGFGDVGGASRFFYCAKASKSERQIGTTKNTHPTVKPLKLMDWLVGMLTPPGGIVLDPFCGSGTTLVAAAGAGFDAVGIDRDEAGEYLEIARLRLMDAGVEPETVELPVAS